MDDSLFHKNLKNIGVHQAGKSFSSQSQTQKGESVIIVRQSINRINSMKGIKGHCELNS